MLEIVAMLVLLAVWIVLCTVDILVYARTPYEVRCTWPWWRYLPGGAIVARSLLIPSEKGQDTSRPRCRVCGTTDHHVDEDGNIVQNPPRIA